MSPTNREEETMSDDPNRPDGIDTAGTTVPPYEGRRESADRDADADAVRDGARVGGATGPVRNDDMAAPDPNDTPGGRTGSPADEQPAGEMPQTDLDDDRVGPAHDAGAPRGEDQDE
jgi:hypothetical protein